MRRGSQVFQKRSDIYRQVWYAELLHAGTQILLSEMYCACLTLTLFVGMLLFRTCDLSLMEFRSR
ncbi:hypothetical protein WK51_18975 [Burkholderia ubonensis]|nr:hypothetical protein WK51_18975 [Burkholderia ubonensis]